MLGVQELKSYAASLSIPVCGVCSAEKDEELVQRLTKRRASFPLCDFEEKDIDKRANPSLLLADAKSLFVCLFPYYRSQLTPINLSRYAMVPDYHKIVRTYLDKIANFIQSREPQAQVVNLCDSTPLVDRWMAYQAGLGFFGKNNLLIHPTYGSWFFIGAILTNIFLEPDKPMENCCANCGACIQACPGRALSEDFGFYCKRCISYLTQKKDVTAEQKKLITSQDSVYGCDVCQQVCPYNQQVPDTPIPEFYEHSITQLNKEEIENLSGRGFKQTYENYAFSWCSKKTILKNFQ